MATSIAETPAASDSEVRSRRSMVVTVGGDPDRWAPARDLTSSR